MNNQEFFTASVQHLRRQGEKAIIQTGVSGEEIVSTCRYRTPDGKMCAVGCVIPEKEYKAVMEGKGAAYLAQVYQVSTLQDVDSRLLTEMQRVHDSCSIAIWENQFQWVATDFKLKVPPHE